MCMFIICSVRKMAKVSFVAYFLVTCMCLMKICIAPNSFVCHRATLPQDGYTLFKLDGIQMFAT